MPKIGHGMYAVLTSIMVFLTPSIELQAVNFHTTSIVNKPFHALDVQRDSLQQAVPTGVLQIQPALGTSNMAHDGMHGLFVDFRR